MMNFFKKLFQNDSQQSIRSTSQSTWNTEVESIKNSTPSVVVIGNQGTGKTILFNKCCNKNCKVAAGGSSVTNEIYMTESVYGKGFKMLDTPGLEALSDKLKHVVAIAVALSEGPVHQILITIKFDRIELLIKQLKPMINYQFGKFKDIITVAVTHWDYAIQDIDKNNNKLKQETQLQRKQELENFIKQLNVLLYYQLVKKILVKSFVIRQMKQQLNKNQVQVNGALQMKLKCQLFLIQLIFRIIVKLNQVKQKKQLFKNLGKYTLIIQSFIESLNPKTPNLVDIMHNLTLFIKDEAKYTIEQYEKDNLALVDELYKQLPDKDATFIIHAQLKSALNNQVEEIMSQAQSKMKLDDKHFYNYIRKCPNCKTIWMKVQGCNGLTTCGNFPENDELLMQQTPYRKYKFQINNQSVSFELQGQEFKNQNKQYHLDAQQKKLAVENKLHGQKCQFLKIINQRIYIIQELQITSQMQNMKNKFSKKSWKKKYLKKKINKNYLSLINKFYLILKYLIICFQQQLLVFLQLYQQQIQKQ